MASSTVSDLKADLIEKIVQAKPTKVFETDIISSLTKSRGFLWLTQQWRIQLCRKGVSGLKNVRKARAKFLKAMAIFINHAHFRSKMACSKLLVAFEDRIRSKYSYVSCSMAFCIHLSSSGDLNRS